MLPRHIYLLVPLLLMVPFSGGPLLAADCGNVPYCKNVKSCSDAMFYLEVCGAGRLDRDRDGIPCENVCGQRLTPTLKAMKLKIRQQKPGTALGLISQPPSGGVKPDLTCGSKRYCREMTSCKEATFHMTKCGLKSLDGDRDGKPCNRICR